MTERYGDVVNGTSGQFGDGLKVNRPSGPSSMPISDVKDVSLGGDYAFITKNDGTIWYTGYNTYGQLGNGGTANTLSFTKHPITNVKTISCSYYTTAFLKNDGSIWACGLNGNYQLGNSVPGSGVLTLTEITLFGKNNNSVSMGYNHTVVVKNDGSVWACGVNSYGQVGHGAMIASRPWGQITGIVAERVYC